MKLPSVLIDSRESCQLLGGEAVTKRAIWIKGVLPLFILPLLGLSWLPIP